MGTKAVWTWVHGTLSQKSGENQIQVLCFLTKYLNISHDVTLRDVILVSKINASWYGCIALQCWMLCNSSNSLEMYFQCGIDY